MTTASTLTTLITIFSSKRWVFATSQNGTFIKFELGLFTQVHLLPPFPAEAVPRHQSAQQEVSAAFAPWSAVWPERGLPYERRPCSQRDRAAGLLCHFLPPHSLHRSDLLHHRRSSYHHQVRALWGFEKQSGVFTGLSQQILGPLEFSYHFLQHFSSSCSVVDRESWIFPLPPD